MAKRWYSVSVLSNFEKKIAEQIRTKVAEQQLEDVIDEVLVPTEEVIEVRRGKKVSTERRFMPGYVLVHMEMSDKGYHLVTSINRVTGFLGPQGRPMPMRDAEVESELMTFLNQIETHSGKPTILKIGPDFEARYLLASRFDRQLWLTRNLFQPDYAGRPWALWTANTSLANDVVDGGLRWVVVQP